DADDLLRRGEAAEHVLADGALLHAGDELLAELEVDIGLEQRLAHLAHGVCDVFFSEFALAAEPAKDLVEALLQTLEHIWKSLRGRRSRMRRFAGAGFS